MDKKSVPTRYGILEAFSASLDYDKDTYSFQDVPPSWVYLARVALNEQGLDMGFEELEKFLYDEGMAPAYPYRIPKWYRVKYNIK